VPANPDARSYLIRFGPYRPPKVRIGEQTQCEIRGLVEVADWSDRGDIMWPRARTTTKRGLIVAGDLVRALRQETELAVSKLWGVAPRTVMKWKDALAIPFRTPGTEAVSAERSRESMLGRRALPQTKAALLRAAQRPKSKRWRRKMSARQKLRALLAGKEMTTHDADRLYEMLEMRANGATLISIADRYGVTRQSVQQTLANAMTRRKFVRDLGYKCPRCKCRAYSAAYAIKIGHRC
jgi:hypothetical protein